MMHAMSETYQYPAVLCPLLESPLTLQLSWLSHIKSAKMHLVHKPLIFNMSELEEPEALSEATLLQPAAKMGF